ncbi:hypothetical protein CDD83_3919 [Cordyceps sp. RAO-2017]|nr:hypothetical protein CDD83_3919 [Cordyceps sp. RAO-2017]
MADFLASFNLGADDGAPPQPSTCASIEGLQLRLAATLADKSTETRVEHVSTSLDICATTHLTVSFSMEENGVLEALSNLDPSLGGLHSTSVSVDTAEEQAMRKITASDALTNQPQDDPVLQRAVAKLIISAVSATDSSTWVVRDMSRGPQGWNFTYICDNSFQQWNIQNKGKTDAIIGEYTLREPDPVLMSRPAYDCRGTIKIAFSRGARSISIKYDHTPLHRTVAEAAEYFKPPPRPVMVRKANKQKSPKKQGSARKKRESTKALDENGNPKKRKRNNKGQAQQPAALTEHEQQQPQLVEPQQNDQQTLQVADGSAPDPTQSAQGPSFVPPGTTIPLNLSPEEATRRRDVAVKLLSDAGVDPATLSTEQFNIFANQSPDLQRESLNMLVKYVEAGKAGKRGRDRKPGKSRNACKQCKSRKVKVGTHLP